MTESDARPLLAAVALDADAHIEGFLLPLVADLRAAGWSIGGMTAPLDEFHDECRHAMHLDDLISGERIKISQDLGCASDACALDPAQLALAGRFITRALALPVDLVVVNKFGKFEAAGAGLRAELIDALEAGVPVLTTVKPAIVGAWQDFVGEYGALLPPERAAVMAWCHAVRPNATLTATSHPQP